MPGASEAFRIFKKRVVASFMALNPPPSTTLVEWADTYRQLATSAGSTAGQWSTERVEAARGPMMAVTEPGVSVITLMVATQTLKTSLLENVIGYHAHLDPCPMLLIQPKDESVAAFSKERLVPMVRATPVLRDLIGDVRTKNGRQNDTIRTKMFPGGFLAMVSAGSPANLAMRPIRIVLEDEVDKYETTKEGDPILLAEERMATFVNNRLAIRACSPTWEEASRIFRSYLSGDMRKPFVDCPHCDHMQHFDFFKHVHWEKDGDGGHLPATAKLKCEACEKTITESERLLIVGTPGISKGKVRYYQTREFECCGVKQKPELERNWKWDDKNQVGRATCRECGQMAVPNYHASFGHVSKIYSPFITIAELATKWIDAKDDPESKQTFYNTQLGLPFKADALKEIQASGLKAREEDYDAAKELPPGVIVLTCGVDVQSGGSANMGRLEVETLGIGLGEETWSVSYDVIEGDPAKAEVWAALDEILMRGYHHPTGHIIQPSAVCVDSGGHNTQDVYKFCRARMNRNVWAIKGATDRGGQWTPIWPPRGQEKKRYRTGFRPIIVGVNSAKEAVRQRLLIESPGHGYCHFPKGRPQSYYDQLTAERLILEKKPGATIRKWVLPRQRANEALDCRTYAYAALWGLYHARRFKLEKQFALIHSMTPAVSPETPEDSGENTVKTPARPVVRRSNFLG